MEHSLENKIFVGIAAAVVHRAGVVFVEAAAEYDNCFFDCTKDRNY